MIYHPWDKPSVVFGFVLGMGFTYLLYTVIDFFLRRKEANTPDVRTCQWCKNEYVREASDSDLQWTFCGLMCQYQDLLAKVIGWGCDPNLAKAIVDKDPRFAKFSGRMGSS